MQTYHAQVHEPHAFRFDDPRQTDDRRAEAHEVQRALHHTEHRPEDGGAAERHSDWRRPFDDPHGTRGGLETRHQRCVAPQDQQGVEPGPVEVLQQKEQAEIRAADSAVVIAFDVEDSGRA